MSETPELPPLPERLDLHGLALDYRTAQHYAETHVAWLKLEARVLNMVEDAREAGRRAGLEEAAKLTPVAPWPDFAGQPIRHGDRLRHPNDHGEFIAVRLNGYAEESDAWRAIYDGESVPSRLGLQIGDKGRAVVIREYGECGGTGRAKP